MDPTKPLTDLSLEEAREICEVTWGSVPVESMAAVACHLRAVDEFARRPQQCEAMAQGCVTVAVERSELNMYCERAASSWHQLWSTSKCVAHIEAGDYEDCAAAAAQVYSELGRTISCATARASVAAIEMPASCRRIMDICGAVSQ